MSDTGWIAVDLDGTLAHYDGWVDELHIGKPVPAMVQRVIKWLTDGRDVRIFTARIAERDENVRKAIITVIELWCDEHIGAALPITNVKDMHMVELWDDRCVQVEKNTGRRLVKAKGVEQ